MRLSLVVAVSENGVIGHRKTLPWNLREDLARFRALTMGHPVIMGRRSCESIGKPLAGRRNIVLSRRRDYLPYGLPPSSDLYVVHSKEEAVRIAGSLEREEAFVIGGEQVYRLFLPSADRVYMTRIHRRFEGDVFFPELGSAWEKSQREDHMNARPLPYSFLVYERAHG